MESQSKSINGFEELIGLQSKINKFLPLGFHFYGQMKMYSGLRDTLIRLMLQSNYQEIYNIYLMIFESFYLIS